MPQLKPRPLLDSLTADLIGVALLALTIPAIGHLAGGAL